MVREILVLQVGQAGNCIGEQFWRIIMDEHGMTPDGEFSGRSDMQVYGSRIHFYETLAGRFVPRSLSIDLKAGMVGRLRDSPIGRLFKPESFLCTSSAGGNNNFGVGYLCDGVYLVEQVMDSVRREIEFCDCAQGFMMAHSIGGGTGSGVGSLIVDKLRDLLKGKTVTTFTVIPSPKVSDVVVEPYNSLLALSHLYCTTNGSHFSVALDNEALYQICYGKMAKIQPSYSDLNRLISMAMSGVTTSVRFPGQLNADLRKIHHNMVPYARLHFLMCALAPIVALKEDSTHVGNFSSIHDIVSQLFNPLSMMAACDPRRGKYFSCAALWRGRCSPRKVEEALIRYQNRNSALFVDSIPDNVKTALCDIPFRGVGTGATFLVNSTAFHLILKRVVRQFEGMYKKKQAFTQWFLNAGLHRDDFQDAKNSLSETVEDYQVKESERFPVDALPDMSDADDDGDDGDDSVNS